MTRNDLRRKNERLRDQIAQVVEKDPELRDVTEGIALRQDLHVEVGTSFLEHRRMTTMERAFHLARSGRFTRLTEVVTTLYREGYSASQIQGPLLKRQLTGLIKAARPEPLDIDLSRGVRGN